MEKPEAKKRDLLVSSSITQSSVKDTLKEIFEINADDDQKEETYKGWKREPIRLFINSYGGSVYDGLALVDVIKHSKTPVHTICIGSCMSMALWVWMSGSKRLIGENGTLMFHDIYTATYGKTEEIKQDLDESVRLQKSLVSEIVSKSLVKEETLQDYITRKAEWFIPAAEAIDLKLADGYYK
jgi:ATP-dependent Clp protease protease subunit